MKATSIVQCFFTFFFSMAFQIELKTIPYMLMHVYRPVFISFVYIYSQLKLFNGKLCKSKHKFASADQRICSDYENLVHFGCQTTDFKDIYSAYNSMVKYHPINVTFNHSDFLFSRKDIFFSFSRRDAIVVFGSGKKLILRNSGR